MKKFKLEDIEKKNVFETPEGYFKDLPSIIQSKAVKPQSEPFWKVAFASPVLKVTLPALLILAVFIWKVDWSGTTEIPNEVSSEEILASISADEVKEYLLEESGLSHSEMIEFAQEQGVSLSEETNSTSSSLEDEILDEIDLEDLEDLM